MCDYRLPMTCKINSKKKFTAPNASCCVQSSGPTTAMQQLVAANNLRQRSVRVDLRYQQVFSVTRLAAPENKHIGIGFELKM
jgi:hypothetical protein